MRDTRPTKARSAQAKAGRKIAPAETGDHVEAVELCSSVESWFHGAARDLPWRTLAGAAIAPGWRRDPYRSLVSEAMLQQTQVSRVVERFVQFMERFPTVSVLAEASEHDVLAMWAGLGYYRRARNLHAAARAIAQQFGGRMPRDVAELQRLPGIGPYTAGAIASMAGGERVPLVDGNVVRVLLRVAAREGNAGDADTMKWTWRRAGELVSHAGDPGAFNEGLMELGALICKPVNPTCGTCPLRDRCQARAAGLQDVIPSPKKEATRSCVYCAAVVVVDDQGRVLLEQRGESGMWAAMWQTPTLETSDAPATSRRVKKWIGERTRLPAPLPGVERVTSFIHETTHRHMVFDVWRVHLQGAAEGNANDARSNVAGRWLQPPEAMAMPVSNAQRRVLTLGVASVPDVPGRVKRPPRARRGEARIMDGQPR
ncbi:MAG: A/G-specific adenine glycosylase [Pyrinomonadaceae bacterium]|nr:A/G-specific adenine glycosylase [Phycisphaerales bacterium]